MISLEHLNEAQRLVYATANQFAQTELARMVAESPGDQALVSRVVPRMAEIGLLGEPFPSEYGGAEIDYVSLCLVCEAIGGVSASAFTGALTVQLSLVSSALNKFGTEEQKQTVLKALLTGQAVGAFALTEPNSGSDPAAAQTFAQKTADGWTLNGTKLWISNGTIADYIIVFAQTDPGTRHRGMAAFIVRREDEGVSTRRIPGKLGLLESDTAEIVLESVHLPDSALLGPVGAGFKISQTSLEMGRLTTAACGVGITQACVDRCVQYAQTREQWGKPIGAHQLVQELVADMAIAAHASRLLVHHAAGVIDSGRSARSEVAMAKQFATESAVRSARNAISMHGAVGYVEEMGVGPLLRDAIGLSLYEGTNQIQTLLVAREVLGISAF